MTGGSGVTTSPDAGILGSEERTQISQTREPGAQGAVVPLRKGAVVGRYVILERLGTGGLGEVYRAYDPDLDRQVAVKVLKRGLLVEKGAESLTQRLVVEARSLAKLSHPNVVTVHDVGRVEDRPFIAMELVEGLTLGAWLADSKRGWVEIRDVFVQAAQGLAAAHQRGLVHRDFKPSNVLVGADGIVRVVDFGLARALAGGDGEDHEHASQPSPEPRVATESLTGTGELLGTPAYMSPEQHEGRAAGTKTDQFSFCAAFYEALYGLRPYRGRTQEAIRAAIQHGAIEEPDNQRSVPAWLRRALLRGLAVDPEQRFPTMEALIQSVTRDRRRRRTQWVSVMAGMVISGAAVWGGTQLLRPEPTVVELGTVDTLARAAKEAAAKFYFVFPPPDDIDYPTAFRKVVELEQLDGAARSLGAKRASELRMEFSDTLIRIGDEYWDRDGGRPFATDFYAAALVFSPEDGHAKQRARVSPAELEGLRERAVSRAFRASELDAAVPMLVLAEPDEQARAAKLDELYGPQAGAAGARGTRAALERVVRRKGAKPAATEAAPVKVRPTRADAAATAPLVPEGPSADAADPSADSSGAASQAPAARQGRDPQAARKEVQTAEKALAAGQLGTAEEAFHRALAQDPRHLAALRGLSRLYFERSAYRRSLTFAKRATRASPKDPESRFLLGNAFVKILEYKNAHREYKIAADLGHAGAQRRLTWLEAKLGSSPQ